MGSARGGRTTGMMIQCVQYECESGNFSFLPFWGFFSVFGVFFLFFGFIFLLKSAKTHFIDSDFENLDFDDNNAGLQLSNETIEVIQMSKHTVSRSKDPGGGLVIDKNRVNTLINLKEEAKKKQPYETSKLAQRFLFSTQNKNEEIKKQEKITEIRTRKASSVRKKSTIVLAAVAKTNEIQIEDGSLGIDPLMMTPKIIRKTFSNKLGSVSESRSSDSDNQVNNNNSGNTLSSIKVQLGTGVINNNTAQWVQTKSGHFQVVFQVNSSEIGEAYPKISQKVEKRGKGEKGRLKNS